MKSLVIKKLCGNLLLLSFCVWGTFQFIGDSDVLKAKRDLTILNNLMPRSFIYLKDIQKGGEVNRDRLARYIFYYQKVNEHMPHRADVLGLLGFCYFHLGDPIAAMDYYKRAIALNPDFFWYYYNLGVIQLKGKQFEQALRTFKKATAINPDTSLKMILHSRRIYMPIVLDITEDKQQFLLKQMVKGYQDSQKALYLILKIANLKNQPPLLTNEFQLQIF